MAENAAIIDSQDHSDADLQLQFQDFGGGYEHNQGTITKTQIHRFTDFPEGPGSDGENAAESGDLLLDKSAESTSSSSFFSFAYYQKYFDVETSQVVRRILWSMIPRPKSNYLDAHIRPNPDLYGPFWICTTLIFAVAIGGNLANYLMNAGQEDYHTKYDFHKVSIAATVVYTYASLVPLGLWLVLWYRKNDSNYTLLEILCVYGYSLTIYIPVAILWTIPMETLRWILVFTGSTLSGSVLLSAMWPAFHNETKKISISVMLLQFALHMLLAVGFVMYFFRSSHDASHDAATQATRLVAQNVSASLNATTSIPVNSSKI